MIRAVNGMRMRFTHHISESFDFVAGTGSKDTSRIVRTTYSASLGMS
jgi:hypothetical protein